MNRLLTTLLLLFSTFQLHAINYDKERQQLLEIFANEWISHCVYTATKMGIAEQLDSGPLTIEEIGKNLNAHTDSLYRVMRALASRGIFLEGDNRTFSHTPASRLLSKNHPSTLHNMSLFYGSVIHSSWEGFSDGVLVGQPGFDIVHKQSIWNFFQQHPNQRTLFMDAMSEKATAVVQSSIQAYDFSRFNTVYDIGGGQGHFLWALLEAYDHLTGILFELPDIIHTLKVPESKFESRVKILGGDFFKTVPEGGDLYIMKSILHDWKDEDAKQILTSVHRAMGPKSLLLIVEPVLLPANEKDYAKAMDILMMNVAGGRERSLDDFKQLLESSGFKLKGVHPTSTEFRLLEARKV